MKRYLLFLAIVLASCSSNSTSPMPAGTSHPFPTSFKQLIISYRNIPEHWSSSAYAWHDEDSSGRWVTRIDENYTDSGTSIFAGTHNASFSPSAFTRSDDTLKAAGLVLVVDTIGGIIRRLRYSTSQNFGAGEAGWSIDAGQLPYINSSNQIIGTQRGETLATSLTSLDTTYMFGFNQEHQGQSSFYSRSFIAAAGDSASLVVRLIP